LAQVSGTQGAAVARSSDPNVLGSITASGNDLQPDARLVSNIQRLVRDFTRHDVKAPCLVLRACHSA
jgi:hypothetical protein